MGKNFNFEINFVRHCQIILSVSVNLIDTNMSQRGGLENISNVRVYLYPCIQN
eukprot:GAHX01003532.1.p1 GENE.GAHX01003532.1~~GAHX01003532.1.p1  ORF type:complete len:53 (-),score=3.62 GAHX01003532.1:312-470(-)